MVFFTKISKTSASVLKPHFLVPSHRPCSPTPFMSALRLFVPFVLTGITAISSSFAQTPVYQAVAAAPFQSRSGLGHFFFKCEQGGPVKVAYLGGSITAAAGWRVKSLHWLRTQFPEAEFSEVHAAIGGTGSDLGVFRVAHDALEHNPDLLFVEFSVNDRNATPERIWKAMEGIVRQTWSRSPKCDICFIYTFTNGYENSFADGVLPQSQSAMEMLADFYAIPSINFAEHTAQLLRDGKLIIKAPETGEAPPNVLVFSKDGVHPLDAGHSMYQTVLEKAFTAFRTHKELPDHAPRLSREFIQGHWQDAKLVPIEKHHLFGEWHPLPQKMTIYKTATGRMPAVWESLTPGAELKFRFNGTTAKLYDIVGPDGGQVDIIVDGKARGPFALFDSYCSYHRIATISLGEDLPPGEHSVVVTLRPDQPDRSPVTNKEKVKPGFNSEIYNGTALRIGGILLRGELLPENP
jgi:hypothetical protein